MFSPWERPWRAWGCRGKVGPGPQPHVWGEASPIVAELLLGTGSCKDIRVRYMHLLPIKGSGTQVLAVSAWPDSIVSRWV